MALEFQKIGDVELLDSVPDTANAVVEVDGAIKRVPGSNLGGGGIPTAIIHIDMGDSGDVAPSSLATLASDGARTSAYTYTFTCENMTFEEAAAIMAAHQPLVVVIDIMLEGVYACGYAAYLMHTAGDGIETIVIKSAEGGKIYWTADGISTESPNADS